jgi:hypothetical protein
MNLGPMMFRASKRRKCKICFAAMILLAARAPTARQPTASPLSRHVSHFSIGKTTVLDALVWFGREEHISFGIEFYGDLRRTVQINVDDTTVREIVQRILGSTDAYRLSASDNVMLIRRTRGPFPDWLNYRLPLFRVPRGELMAVNNELWMALEMNLDPSKHGFLGDCPPTNPINEVGPFNEHGKTVQALLIKIVAASRGATWYPTQNVQSPAPATVNGFWTLVTYSRNWASRPK